MYKGLSWMNAFDFFIFTSFEDSFVQRFSTLKSKVSSFKLDKSFVSDYLLFYNYSFSYLTDRFLFDSDPLLLSSLQQTFSKPLMVQMKTRYLLKKYR